MKAIKDVAKIGEIWKYDYSIMPNEAQRFVVITKNEGYEIHGYHMLNHTGVNFSLYKFDFYKHYSLFQGVDNVAN